MSVPANSTVVSTAGYTMCFYVELVGLYHQCERFRVKGSAVLESVEALGPSRCDQELKEDA